MIFNSFEFAVFFPLVCAVFFCGPARGQTPVLLIASCVFYMAFIPAYILVLGVTIAVDYAAGIYLERTAGRTRKALLVGSIGATCLVLFVFKYYNFFAGAVIGLAHLAGWQPPDASANIILPIGLSFHTFQSLSYVIEVYRGRQRAEHSFVRYATYVMFFPQLVAGPIERPQHLLHQFRQPHDFEYARVVSGLKRMAWGLFKKVVIADRLALYVNDVYAAPQAYNGLQLTIATLFFAYQIYCDFSGYSDIAIGSARVLGFTLRENFDRPYHAHSLADFWRRWHISLSTWFRDYVYIPMGGSHVGGWRWVRNILVTFGLSGLWHGANWTYISWGLLNGVLFVGGKFTRPLRERLYSVVGLAESAVPRRTVMIISTFLLVCGGWVVFRAPSLADAAYIFAHWTQGWDFNAITTPHFFAKHFPTAIASILGLELAQVANNRFHLADRIATLPTLIRWPGYLGFVTSLILFGVYRANPFIYFQF